MQVWLLVSECLSKVDNAQTDIVYLLFFLSYCKVGKGYPISCLSSSQKSILDIFSDMGLLYLHEAKESTFFPTTIAVNMLEQSASVSESIRRGVNTVSITVIVETNFQVVAYVDSSLHIAMLRLFVDARTMIRLPNMVMGNITRDSAKSAFKLGISAQQIIEFLTNHAHPLTAARLPVIPENVSDQLKLWQAEKKRYACQPAVIVDVKDFAQGSYLSIVYNKLVDYAKDIEALIWTNSDLKEFAVKPDSLVHMKAFAARIDE